MGKGVSTHIACPVFDVCGMSLAYFAGEYFFVGGEKSYVFLCVMCACVSVSLSLRICRYASP